MRTLSIPRSGSALSSHISCGSRNRSSEKFPFHSEPLVTLYTERESGTIFSIVGNSCRKRVDKNENLPPDDEASPLDRPPPRGHSHSRAHAHTRARAPEGRRPSTGPGVGWDGVGWVGAVRCGGGGERQDPRGARRREDRSRGVADPPLGVTRAQVSGPLRQGRGDPPPLRCPHHVFGLFGLGVGRSRRVPTRRARLSNTGGVG